MNKQLNVRQAFDSTCLVGALAFGSLLASGVNAAVIGHWTFNENTGTVAIDHSGQGNHGDILNGATFVASPGGFAIALDGADDRVNFGQPSIFDFTSQAFTIESWVQVDASSQTGGNHGIFGKNSQSWLLGFEIRFNWFKRFNFRFSTDGGAGAGENPENALDFSEYHHLLATRGANGSDPVQFYVNGHCVSTNELGQCDASGRQDLLSGEDADVVAGQGSGNHLECQIDEIRVQDVRVDAAQAMALFNAGPSTAPSNPFAESSEVPVEDVFFAEIECQDGLTYQLECTTDLETPNWAGAGGIVNGTGANGILFDPSGVSAGKSYRVVIQ